MITALLNNQKIDCFSGKYDRETLKKWAAKGIILCPACGKPYEYCHGKINSPYFRHKDKAQCEDLYSEPETQEHIDGKIHLYEWVCALPDVTDATLEGWLPETKQRPDIVFKMGGKQYVIEYQCTPIASEYIERHKLYQVAGIVDIWVCGTEKYMHHNRRTIEKKSTGRYNTCTMKFTPNHDHVDYRTKLNGARKRDSSFGKFDLSECAIFGSEIYSVAESTYYIEFPERTRLNRIRREQRLNDIMSICFSTVENMQNKYGDNEVYIDTKCLPIDCLCRIWLGWSIAYIYKSHIDFCAVTNWPLPFVVCADEIHYYRNPNRIESIITEYIAENYKSNIKVAN